MFKCLSFSFLACLSLQGFALKRPIQIFISKWGTSFAAYKDHHGLTHKLIRSGGRFEEIESTSPAIVCALANAIEDAEREKQRLGIKEPYNSLWTKYRSQVKKGMHATGQKK